jgi:hypothetical protein
MDINVPFVCSSQAAMNINFPMYMEGALPDKERFNGRISLSIKYGHPDEGYSRVMIRKLQFSQVIKPIMPEGLPGMLIPMGGSLPLNCGPYEEDKDIPYLEPN